MRLRRLRRDPSRALSQAIKTRPRVLRADAGADTTRARFALARSDRVSRLEDVTRCCSRPRPHTPIPVQHACLINLRLCTQAPAGALEAIIGAAREDAGLGSLGSVTLAGAGALGDRGLTIDYPHTTQREISHINSSRALPRSAPSGPVVRAARRPTRISADGAASRRPRRFLCGAAPRPGLKRGGIALGVPLDATSCARS